MGKLISCLWYLSISFLLAHEAFPTSNVFVHHDEDAHIAQCRRGGGCSPVAPSTGFLTFDPSQVVYSLLTYRIVSATWGLRARHLMLTEQN